MQQTRSNTYHEGRPIIRDVGPIIGVLCPYGHVITHINRKDWAGSWLEAKAGDPTWTVTCDGGATEKGSLMTDPRTPQTEPTQQQSDDSLAFAREQAAEFRRLAEVTPTAIYLRSAE